MTSCHIIHIGTLSMNRFWGETERVREPSATCTLIVAGGQRLLVDPSPHPDALERALADRTGLRPADIDLVYLTHFHGDHRFGLSLFEDRPLLMAEAGIAEWIGRSPGDAELAGRFCPAEDRLPAGV
ncbi:MAG: MBL fold metallo-hydrolase, partial [Victivallales bacterium]|nr:MBL fold metallo-hydrolase [Victivallales bacterium]